MPSLFFRTAPLSFLAVVGSLAVGSLGGASYSRDFIVTSAADISRLAQEARPGDSLLMADGVWKDQHIAFKAKGAPNNPITLRAQTPGNVILSGDSTIHLDGEHVTVSGLRLKDTASTNQGITIAGANNRLTETAIEGGAYRFFVRMHGTSNRLDHCYLADKTTDHPTLQIEVEGQPNHHRIDHNHFGPRPPLGRNGGETIRVGYSFQSMTNSAMIIENNLFDRCDGELEIISSKSCENIYRRNTFLNCAGTLTLRHGNRCIVDGNIFLGQNKKGSGGIRIIGEDHIVINNYIDSVAMGGFWITAGIPNSELRGYFQARNCVIANNTFINSPGPAIQLDAGMGSSRRTLRPENITIASNIFAITSGQLFKGTAGSNYTWRSNVAYSPNPEIGEQPGVILKDLRQITVPNVRALTTADVGPSWRRSAP